MFTSLRGQDFDQIVAHMTCCLKDIAASGVVTMVFHVGQQVVCVDDRFSDHEVWRRAVRSFPKLHGVYTIREIIEDDDGLSGFCFYEIENPLALFLNGYLEPAFNSSNFRPVRKTSIEAFERLLAPTDRVEAT